MSFIDEVNLLKQHYQPIVIEQGDRKISVLAELQGRVMTSTAQGDDGDTFGWINHKYLEKPHTERNAVIGGADRFWLGPEAGTYSVFFEPGTETIAENIKIPDAISMTPFDVINQTEKQVIFEKELSVTNHFGFEFSLQVNRSVTLFDDYEIGHHLGLEVPDDVSYVGFGSHTRITNIGHLQWVQDTGLLSIWSLSAFKPNDSTTVVVPLITLADKRELNEVTAYFNETRESHALIKSHAGTEDQTLFYRADGKYMNKVGVPPEYTRPVMGSYDADRQLLTLILFHISRDKDAAYVNSVWDWSSDPYQGEIINIFNDGPEATEGGVPFGPLYEMESSSAALELGQGESQMHFHHTYHFQGDKKALNAISKNILGVDIETIEAVFAQ